MDRSGRRSTGENLTNDSIIDLDEVDVDFDVERSRTSVNNVANKPEVFQNCRKEKCNHCAGKKVGDKNLQNCTCNLTKVPQPQANYNNMNTSRGINRPLNDLPDPSAGPSSTPGQTQDAYNSSMRYCEKLLDLIEKRTRVLQNMSFGSESSDQISDFRPPSGMNLTYGSDSDEPQQNVSRHSRRNTSRSRDGTGPLSSSRNVSVGQRTSEIIHISDDPGTSLGRLDLSRIPHSSASRANLTSREERSGGFGQRTSEIIHISDDTDSSLGLLNLSRVSAANNSRASSSRRGDRSMGQRNNEIIHMSDGMDSSLGLLNLSRVSAANNSRASSSRRGDRSMGQRTSEIIHISDGMDSSLGVLNLSGVSVNEPNASVRQQAAISRHSQGPQLEDISEITLYDSRNSNSIHAAPSRQFRQNNLSFHSAPGGDGTRYQRSSEIIHKSAPPGVSSRYFRSSNISNLSHEEPPSNLSQFSLPDDSKISILKFIGDISHITMVDLPVPDTIECDNEDKIVVIKNPQFEDWKINIKLTSEDPAASNLPVLPPLVPEERRTICSFRKSSVSQAPKKEVKTESKATQTDPVIILGMDIDDKMSQRRNEILREPEPIAGPSGLQRPVEPVAGPSGIQKPQSKIPQMGQAKKSFLPKIVRVPVKETTAKPPKSSPPKKKGNIKPPKKGKKK